jgi:hypothetical protein
MHLLLHCHLIDVRHHPNSNVHLACQRIDKAGF